MVPSERIKLAGVSKIRRRYSESCNLTRTIAMREFDYFYRESGVSSVAVLARTVGLSQHQFNRILSGKGFPAQELYAPARTKLLEMFGIPNLDLQQMQNQKREMAVKVVLSATELSERAGKREAPSHFQQLASKIAELAVEVVPPAHDVMNDAAQYPKWTKSICDTHNIENHATVDGLGMFLACREYLPGFVDNIVAKAKFLVASCDGVASQVLQDVNAITLVLACFQEACGNLKLVRRNLFTVLSLPYQRRTSDREFVSELVDRWSLNIQQFEAPDATEGFLLMESQICRSRVLQVLNNAKTY